MPKPPPHKLHPMDDPELERVMHIELGIVEAFEATDKEGVLRAIEALLGPHDPEASKLPEPSKIRGGPHPVGPHAWRSWRVDMADKPFSTMRRWTVEGSARDEILSQVEQVWLHVNWTEHLPFMVAYTSIQYPPTWRPSALGQQYHLQNAWDDFFDLLPGRLSLNNRSPRTPARWLLGAKIPTDLMAEMQDDAKTTPQAGAKTNKGFRYELERLFPVLGSQQGTLLIAAPHSNAMMVTGEGRGYASEVGGAFVAYLVSTGLRIDDDFYPRGYLPMWVPSDLQWLDWHQINFGPFLTSAYLYAASALVEAGDIEVSLKGAVEEIEAPGLVHASHVQLNELRSELGRLQSKAARLELKLHMSAERSNSKLDENLGAALTAQTGAFLLQGWNVFEDETPAKTWVIESVITKRRTETQANGLLALHSRRIAGLLDAIAAEQQHRATKTMRTWAIISGIAGSLAAVAAVIAIIIAM